MKNSIQKLREVILAVSTIPTALPDGCKEINTKYSTCQNKIDACANKGIIEVNSTQWMPDHGGFTPFEWTFKDCDASICKEAYDKKIDTVGQKGSTTTKQDGGFGRGRGAVAPNVMVNMMPDPGDRSKDWNFLMKKETEKRRCDVKTQQLNMQYSLAVAKETELFNLGCPPYVKQASDKPLNQASEEARKKRYNDALKRLNMDYASKMVSLQKTRDCTRGD
jgi:hypothetical protein